MRLLHFGLRNPLRATHAKWTSCPTAYMLEVFASRLPMMMRKWPFRYLYKGGTQ